LLAAGETHRAALVGGFRVGFMVSVGALVVGVIAALLVRPDAGRVLDDPVTSVAVQVTEVELL